MTREETSPLLARLLNAESASEQVATLRLLKHELIGHDQRKETWIHWGIIPLLSRILLSRRGGGKKAATSSEQNGLRRRTDLTRARTEDEEVCLQAVIIVGSLAQGGPAFIPPLLASDIFPSMLYILSSPGCPQWLALPILKTFNAVADRYILQNVNWPQDNHLADVLFTPDYIRCFAHIIAQSSPSQATESCVSLTSNLIAKLCTDESHKTALAEYGVLDALALKVASFVVAQGFVLPGAESHLTEDGSLVSFPPAASSSAKLAPILRATAAIVESSKSRAEHFLTSPSIVAVFPGRVPEFSPTDIRKNPWGMPYLSGAAVPRQNHASPIDAILPSVPQAQTNALTNFPPLLPMGSFHKRSLSFLETSSSDEEENAIVPWLLHLVRTESGMSRVMAARLVTALFRLGFAKKRRIPMFSYLVIPILLRMLEKDYDFKTESDPEYDGLIPTALRLREEVTFILAASVMDTQELQKYAVEGKAIKVLSQLLKETYNAHQANSKVTWYAETKQKDMHSEISPELQLGPVGYSPMTCHIMRYREGILRALSALALFSDEYRKAICQNGVVPYVINSLKPRPPHPSQDSAEIKNSATDGNPLPTLLAACGTARALSRSVSVLRTSLIDAGVAAPLLELIKHHDIQVQIAATSALCNLALDFSPMKEAMISSDILAILCEHAHSTNMKLRLESLWALKHVAYNSANDIRMKILTGLDPSWLGQIMSMDPTIKRENVPTLDIDSPMGMGTSNSAGEKVDLLNPVNAESRDEVMDSAPSLDTVSQTIFFPNPVRRRKLALSGELTQKRQARQDDIAVQEQVLELVQNFMIGTGSSEIVDLLLQEIGEQGFLGIIADKIRPRPMPTRRDTVASANPPVPTEILKAVTFMLINFAAGPPKYRDMLFTHQNLLKDLMWLYDHPNHKIRTNCVWIAINLTISDNQSDQQGCRERALKLKALGIVERLRNTEKDPDLDLKERTKTALNQLRQLVDL
ncbi:armadillo repeat protein [Talaromyces proteolyticus]|uniref:Armadillo repeat protein n=1 Tax=Talaromyces proteolyticus TaxID=1131652 RepID=A0AAD4L0X4_9EURO|nr:armadillo repeat protein [Talaromyces proteolyticus]KAH8704204.1 armadillo repeat protein [Talaromyces proteolyticus]